MPKIYVFGDSFVFGTGVNDEQTFSFLLQNAIPNYKIKLYAFGGYSLTQAYLRFESIKDKITSSDIIILGYADFYNKRHVMSPTRIREINNWIRKKYPDIMQVDYSLPKASLSKNDKIKVDYVNRSCEKNNGYCEKKDPDNSEMTDVTAALINYISDHTNAKVYLLHFRGNSYNPVFNLINKRITKISALQSDFDYFIQDDIEGFDTHPGPYWHYAISRKLIEVLTSTER